MTEERTTCPDCAVAVGSPHEGGCDVARCMKTGMQRISCDHASEGAYDVRDAVGDFLSWWDEKVIAFATTGAVFLTPLKDALQPVRDAFEKADCGEDIWTGEWPGDDDCKRLGFWCFWGPDYGRQGWVRCEPDHPGARPDLNRMLMEATWNPESKRWE